MPGQLILSDDKIFVWESKFFVKMITIIILGKKHQTNELIDNFRQLCVKALQ
jgi:hypothetical protein